MLGKCSTFDPCDTCKVQEDLLMERGVLDKISDLIYGSHYNNNLQPWDFTDIVKVPLSINDGSDETNFTWIIKFEKPQDQGPKAIKGQEKYLWAVVRGGHDYTGWDCQSGIYTEWYATKDDCFATLVDWEREVIGEK